jgi:hypothetical protein
MQKLTFEILSHGGVTLTKVTVDGSTETRESREAAKQAALEAHFGRCEPYVAIARFVEAR